MHELGISVRCFMRILADASIHLNVVFRIRSCRADIPGSEPYFWYRKRAMGSADNFDIPRCGPTRPKCLANNACRAELEHIHLREHGIPST